MEFAGVIQARDIQDSVVLAVRAQEGSGVVCGVSVPG